MSKKVNVTKKNGSAEVKRRVVINKGGSRLKDLCMVRVLNFLIRYFSNYYTLHRSDLAARAAPLDPRLIKKKVT